MLTNQDPPQESVTDRSHSLDAMTDQSYQCDTVAEPCSPNTVDPEQYSQQTITYENVERIYCVRFNKYKTCVEAAAKMAFVDLVKEIYSSNRVATDEGRKSIRDYCKQTGITPTYDLKNRTSLYEGNILLQDFDPLLGYAIMVDICRDVYELLSDHCKEEIENLRMLYRKMNTYQEIIISEDDFNMKIHDLRDSLKVICDEVCELCHKDFTTNLTSLEKVMTNVFITNEMTGDETVNENAEDLSRCKRPIIVISGRRELTLLYQNLTNLHPCTWLDPDAFSILSEGFQGDRVFTQLQIRNNGNLLEMKDLLTVRKIVDGKEKLPTALLLHGLAGCGKTSLCRYLVHDWCTRKNEVAKIDSFDLVIFIELSRIRSGCLREFFREQMLPHTCMDLDPNCIIPQLKELEILFIIDGYEETVKISADLLEDIFAKFGDKQIVLTTRPEFHQDCVFLAQRHRVSYVSLEVCGLSDTQVEDFVCKVFDILMESGTLSEADYGHFLNYINGRGRILDKYLKLPLTTAFLIFLWKENPEALNEMTTATRLYQELLKLFQSRLLQRFSREFKGISDFSNILGDLILHLGEQAWKVLKYGTSIASDTMYRRINEECQGKGMKTLMLLSAFHMCQVNNEEEMCKLTVSFFHGAQMHYLAAAYLSNSVLNKNMKIQDINTLPENCPALHEIIMFTIGHLSLKDALSTSLVTDIFTVMRKVTVEPTDFEFWWNLLAESHHHPQVAAIIAKEKLPYKHWHLNEINVVSGLRLLSQTPVKLTSLTIAISVNTKPHAILHFLEALQEVGQNIRKRQKRLVRVELHLCLHNVGDAEETSEEFIQALQPWGDLTSFTGGLGEYEEELLSGYSSLKVISVRVSSLGGFRTLSSSLKKIHRSVRSLTVTLALPRCFLPEDLSELRISGTLELNLPKITDKQKDWLVAVVKTVGGRSGCWCVGLQECELSYEAVEWLVTQLKGHVHNKIAIETNN